MTVDKVIDILNDEGFDSDDVATYVYGTNDPDTYAMTINDKDELLADFGEFLGAAAATISDHEAMILMGFHEEIRRW